MKEAANSLLKMLEEPPEFATIFLLTDNPSGAAAHDSFALHAAAAGAASGIGGRAVSGRSSVRSGSRASVALVARVCGGGLGRARSFDLAGYLAARQDALTLLAPAHGQGDHSELFRVTDTYRSGADGKAKTEQLIRTLYSLLEDMLFLQVGHPGAGAQSGHPDGAGAHGATDWTSLGSLSADPAAGRNGERHAPQFAALAGARQLSPPHWSATVFTPK